MVGFVMFFMRAWRFLGACCHSETPELRNAANAFSSGKIFEFSRLEVAEMFRKACDLLQ